MTIPNQKMGISPNIAADLVVNTDKVEDSMVKKVVAASIIPEPTAASVLCLTNNL